MFLSRAGVPWRRNYNPPEYAPAAAPACEFNRLVRTLDRAIQQNRFSERRLLFQGVRNLVVVSGQRPDRRNDSAESPEIASEPPNHRPRKCRKSARGAGRLRGCFWGDAGYYARAFSVPSGRGPALSLPRTPTPLTEFNFSLSTKISLVVFSDTALAPHGRNDLLLDDDMI